MRLRTSISLFLACVSIGFGQSAPQSPPDTLLLTSGEKLLGHFVRSAGANVVFKSDALGEVTIPWSKVKDLQASAHYVIIGKDVKLTPRTNTESLPKGAVTEADQILAVEPGSGAAAEKIPVGDTAYVVDESTFREEVFHNPRLYQSWNGTVTAGASFVQATQQARSLTGGIALIRTVPLEDWIDPRNRTILDFTASEGVVTQPGTPKIRTAIYHADAERDEYFRGRDLYTFLQTSFDHNYSQGLDLLSNVGGGIGYTVIKKANETLDFKGSVAYINQSFQAPAESRSLAGSNFMETFTHKTAHNILFAQQITATPSWSEFHAYSWAASASISIPVFKRFSFTTRGVDDFINNPPPGFKKNSFQLITRVAYTLR